MSEPSPNRQDTDLLRRLAARKQEIAASAENREREQAWLALDAGQGDRPMVLIECGGVRDANSPLNQLPVECRSDFARQLERGLRAEIFCFEHIKDDHVVAPFHNLNWRVTASDYGVEVVDHVPAEDGVLMGARNWEPPLKDIDRDFHLLRPRSFSADRAATLELKARLEAVFGGVLPVRIRGGFWWTTGLTGTAIRLVGMENMMLMMYDNPDGLRRLMAFLRDDQLAYAEWLEREGLLTLNNGNDYIGSGSRGHSRSLPAPDHQPGAPARLKDLWVLSESQETVGVGPELFEEFVLAYQLPIVERFGACYYGCCEPVHTRFQAIKKIPNLRRVSVSPWADQGIMAQELGRDYVFSRKPNPAMISAGDYDEDFIRRDLRHTLEVARGCRLEIVMKDVHTLNNQPGRLARWVELAREETAKAAGW